jgi:hypothetical protein
MNEFTPFAMHIGMGFVALLGYMGIVRRAADVVQPLRLQMAELGREVLVSDASADDKSFVRFCLDNAFNAFIPFVGALIMIVGGPVYVLRACYMALANKDFEESSSGDPRVRKMSSLLLISSVAANPFFGTVLVIEVIITAVLTSLLTRQLRAWQSIVMELVTFEIWGERHQNHAHY